MSVMTAIKKTDRSVTRRAIPAVESLPDLLGTGPIERGFYVVPGHLELVPTVLNQLVSFFSSEWGAQSSPSPASSEISSEIGKVMWIDSGNSFDPYALSLSAVRRGLAPTRILRAVQVARPFNAFQLQQMLDKVPNPIPCHTSNGVSWRVPLVVISDLMSLFYDPEIQEGDVQRAFLQFMEGLTALQERAIVVGLLMNYPAPYNRENFLPRIWGMSKKVLLPKRLAPQYEAGVSRPAPFVMPSFQPMTLASAI